MARLLVNVVLDDPEDVPVVEDELRANLAQGVQVFTDSETSRPAVSGIFVKSGRLSEERRAREREFWADFLSEEGISGDVEVRALDIKNRGVGTLLMAGSALTVVGIFASTARGPRQLASPPSVHATTADDLIRHLQEAEIPSLNDAVERAESRKVPWCRLAFDRLQEVRQTQQAAAVHRIESGGRTGGDAERKIAADLEQLADRVARRCIAGVRRA